jgi:hypothetical protein
MTESIRSWGVSLPVSEEAIVVPLKLISEIVRFKPISGLRVSIYHVVETIFRATMEATYRRT